MPCWSVVCPLLFVGRGHDNEKNVSSESTAGAAAVLGGTDPGSIQGDFTAGSPSPSGTGKHRGVPAKNEKRGVAKASPSDVPQAKKTAKHRSSGAARRSDGASAVKVPSSSPAVAGHATVVAAAAGHATVVKKKPADPHVGATTTVISATRTLTAGQSWSSTLARMVMQGDGNLVIYDENGKALWASNTRGSGIRAVFQADGNLVVYNSANQSVWKSSTSGHNGAQLVLQADGNVVIEQGGQEFWASNTEH